VIFNFLVAAVGAIAGAIAAVSGFGIGSVLTPLFAAHYGTKLAVAIVSVPHLVGTAVRFARLRQHVDRRVLIRFGVLSAVGGLLGALLNARADSPALTIVFGLLLLFAGVTSLFGLSERMRFGRKTAWAAGALSGIFGGMVGNQGGIRSAALLGFEISKESFVATATAIALIVDGARLPVYAFAEHRAIAGAWVPIAFGTAGVLIGTLWGVRLLRRIPEETFRRAVSLLIVLLGVYMLVRGIRDAA
jgi:uncharacterized membrane protein YfcA